MAAFNSALTESLVSAPVEVAYRLRVISGNANPQLAAEVARLLGTEVCKARVARFNNGEIDIEIMENVRGDDVYIVQSTNGSEGVDVNTALMELLLLVHTLKISSARRITAVVPMFAYSRQDRKVDSRVPISAAVVAQLIQAMGVDRVMTLDLHCGQIQGFFRNMPLDNLMAAPVYAEHIRKQPWFEPATTVVVSPDAGGVERANILADQIKASAIVTILKRRVEAGRVESMQMAGDVRGFNVVVVDDMIDTGNTLIKACQLIKAGGAKRITVCVTHGILSADACENLAACEALDECIVTDSIPQDRRRERCPKLTVLRIAPLLSQAIDRVHREESVSGLFPKKERSRGMSFSQHRPSASTSMEASTERSPVSAAAAAAAAFPSNPQHA
jgi:ribose-phosphate pyrophosphokinase